jgi:hypothetical protein
MVLAAQVASRVLTFFAMALALAAIGSPYWGQISIAQTAANIKLVSRGLYWPWSATTKNASGIFYETGDFSGDCNTFDRMFTDYLLPFNYVGPFCNGKGADGALWVTAFFGAMTAVLGVVSLVLDVRCSGCNLHLGSVGALLFSSVLTLSVYVASPAFQNAGLRNCASSFLFFKSAISGGTLTQTAWNAVCKDQVLGWGFTIGETTMFGTATGASFLCELSAAVMAFLALVCAYIARLKLRAEGSGDVKLAVKVDP